MDEIIQPSDDVEVRGGGGGRRNRKVCSYSSVYTLTLSLVTHNVSGFCVRQKKKGDQGRLDSMLQRGSSSQQDNEDHFLPLPDVVQVLFTTTTLCGQHVIYSLTP